MCESLDLNEEIILGFREFKMMWNYDLFMLEIVCEDKVIGIWDDILNQF